MASVIIVERPASNAKGWVYIWKCPDCGEEIRKFEYAKQTFLECWKCQTQIFRASVTRNEWDTK